MILSPGKSKKADCFLTVLIGALLCGLLWRLRGSHGWGSESGLFNVGFIMLLFFAIIDRNNVRFTPLAITFTAASFIVTVPQWGTINKQICGGIYNGDDPVIDGVPLWSAILMMLLLGFMTVGLFGIFLGNLFSSKKWKIYHYLILIAVFFGIQYLMKATLAHNLVRMIQPVSYNAFQNGLTENGITESVYRTYLAHFDNVSWAKKIPGGRNYFAEVEIISRFIAIVICQLVTRFGFKDKTTAKISLTSSLGFAFAITAADTFFLIDSEKYSGFISKWSCWEYFTGFIAGGIITLAVLLLKEKNTEDSETLAFIPKKIRGIIQYLIGFCFPVLFNILRPVILRADETDYGWFTAVPAGLIAVAFLLYAGIGKKFDFTDKGVRLFYAPVFTGILLIQILTYFFCLNPDREINAYSQLYNIAVALSAIVLLSFGVIKTGSTIKLKGKP